MSYEITSTDIERLDPHRFVHFVNRLVRAEATRLGIPPTSITTTDRISGRDGGVDARVEDDKGCGDGRWLPRGLSIWQFKTDSSGQNTQPHKLKQEAQKQRVKQALIAGGSYRIAVGKTYNDEMLESRKEAVREALQEQGIPSQRAKVLTADHLAQWASEHPAMMLLACFSIPIGNLVPIEDWERDPAHSVQFVQNQALTEVTEAIRKFALSTDMPCHLRVEGRIGVGKTKLVLEALKDPAIRERAVYAFEPDTLPPEFWPWLRYHQNASVVVVVDDCDMSRAQDLAVQADLCEGRVRLITIGTAHAQLAASSREYIFLDFLDKDCIFKILENEFPAMSREQLGWMVRLASGYPGLALACAGALSRGAAADIGQITRVPDIVHWLSSLIPEETYRKAMQAASLLSRVGVDGEVRPQGEAVANFVGIAWEDFCDGVARGVDLGLVAKQGRYRYVTPDLLAAKLATEVWNARGQETHGLLQSLPDYESKVAFLKRIKDVAMQPQARRLAQQLLSASGLFPNLESMGTPENAELLRELAFADAEAAMRALERLLGGVPPERLREFRKGRRWIVWTLEYLKWFTECFHPAGRLLLSLAEAETENIGNNATGVWVGLFSPSLGGTAVPAVDRHTLIEEALESDSKERRLLGVRAIGSAVPFHQTRTSGLEEHGMRPVPAEWRPTLRSDLERIGRSALRLLTTALKDECPEVAAVARTTLFRATRVVVGWGLADDTLDLLGSLEATSDVQRRELRDCIGNVLEFESDSLTPDQIAKSQQLEEQLVGKTYADRLHRWVGQLSSGDQRMALGSDRQSFQDEVTELAREAIESPELLLPEFHWLTSDDAPNASAFGFHLGKLDADRHWFSKLEELALQDRGILLLASYLNGRWAAGDGEWVEGCLEEWAQREPAMAEVVLQATWALPPSAEALQRILKLVNNGWLDRSRLGSFYFGPWVEQLPASDFLCLVSTLAQVNVQKPSEHALAMMGRRLEAHPEDHDSLDGIAWELLERTEWCVDSATCAHYWHEVAMVYIEDNPVRLAEAILKLYERDDPPSLYHTHLIEALREACDRDLSGVWECIGDMLITDGKINFGLAMDLGSINIPGQGPTGVSFVEDLDHEYLLSWAQSNEPLGAIALAYLAPVKGVPLHPLTRELLVRYGRDDDVTSALHSNFQSGGYAGSTVDWLSQKLRLAKQWEQDLDPNVRAWAGGLVERITAEIETCRVWEEERGIN